MNWQIELLFIRLSFSSNISNWNRVRRWRRKREEEEEEEIEDEDEEVDEEQKDVER